METKRKWKWKQASQVSGQNASNAMAIKFKRVKKFENWHTELTWRSQMFIMLCFPIYVVVE